MSECRWCEVDPCFFGDCEERHGQPPKPAAQQGLDLVSMDWEEVAEKRRYILRQVLDRERRAVDVAQETGVRQNTIHQWLTRERRKRARLQAGPGDSAGAA